MTSTSSLEGNRALVTGGSRGIGAAIVRRLASQGAAVAVLTQDGHLGATYELGGTPFTLIAPPPRSAMSSAPTSSTKTCRSLTTTAFIRFGATLGDGRRRRRRGCRSGSLRVVRR
jgi:NAD(P)-dependent dehydrogenase (short-subunit alcohol dehydrogenase family)